MQIEKLSIGSHKNPEDGACVMEFVSLLANEPFSDRPVCASSSITAFSIWINDKGEEKHRDRLLVLAPRIVGTRDYKKEPRRAELFSEFAFWSAEKAKGFAKSAAEYAAEYAEYAAASHAASHAAAYAAKSAAEYAAKSAAKSAAFKTEMFDRAIETLEKVLAV